MNPVFFMVRLLLLLCFQRGVISEEVVMDSNVRIFLYPFASLYTTASTQCDDNRVPITGLTYTI